MNPASLDYTKLGVAAIVAVLLSIAVVVLWRQNVALSARIVELLEKQLADQAPVLAALISASAAMTEVTRLANRLEDRERGFPQPGGRVN